MLRFIRSLLLPFLIAVRDLARRLFPAAGAERSALATAGWASVECVLFCLTALVVRYWLDPLDPFGVQAQFPWLWIVPALLAMRYGTAIGLMSVIVLVVSWMVLVEQGMLSRQDAAPFPEAYFLGGLILVLVCGQFSDVWNARNRRLRAVNAYLGERLNTLTKNHFLLRLSHSRLEQDLLAKPLTLRETLVRLRTLALNSPPTADRPMPGAAEFIQLLGQSCQLEVAAVYSRMPAGRLDAAPQAAIGSPSPLAVDDPLVAYALAENAMAHLQSGQLASSERDASRYLICAPLLSSYGEQLGLVTVEKLPFFALNGDTLQLLSVLIGYYADGLQIGSVAAPVLAAHPDCPAELALDLVRLHRIRHAAGIDSSLVALVFEHTPQATDIATQVKRLKRGVDLSWEISGERHTALITLLPLASSAAVEGYLLRIESAIQSQFGIGLLDSHVVAHTAQLGFASPADTLTELVQRCAL